MPQTQFGQTDALALAVVAWLTLSSAIIVTDAVGGTSPEIADSYLATGTELNSQSVYLGKTTGLYLYFNGTIWAIGTNTTSAPSFTGQATITGLFSPAQQGYRGSATSTTNWCLPIAAERRFALKDDLPNIPKYNQPASVDVVPDIENSDRQGISTAFLSEYAIHIFIQQQLTGSNEEAQCALLTQLRSQILESMKLAVFMLPSAVHPVLTPAFPIKIMNVDRGFRGKGLYSLDRLLQAHVYESDTIVIFRAAA
jgi:hypothetical protein